MGKLAADDRPIGTGRPGGRCKVWLLWQTLDDDDRAALSGWLADTGNSSTAIQRRLSEHDIKLGHESIQRHRKHTCMCDEEHPEMYPDG